MWKVFCVEIYKQQRCAVYVFKSNMLENIHPACFLHIDSISRICCFCYHKIRNVCVCFGKPDEREYAQKPTVASILTYSISIAGLFVHLHLWLWCTNKNIVSAFSFRSNHKLSMNKKKKTKWSIPKIGCQASYMISIWCHHLWMLYAISICLIWSTLMWVFHNICKKTSLQFYYTILYLYTELMHTDWHLWMVNCSIRVFFHFFCWKSMIWFWVLLRIKFLYHFSIWFLLPRLP